MSTTTGKKILLVLPLPPPVHGASMMNKSLVESELLYEQFEVKVINLQFANAIKKIGQFSFKKVFKTFSFGFQIIRDVLRFRPDMVYFTLSPSGFAFYRDVLYISLLKLLNQQIVLHPHMKGVKKFASRNAFFKSLCTWLLKDTQIICLSSRLTDDFQEYYNGTPYIVHNGIPVYGEGQETREENQTTVPSILFLSNYKREKGVLVLIEALRILREQGVEFNARLVGAPGNVSEAYLENILEEYELSDAVQVTGPRYGVEKYREFQRADLFVFPTLNEAFPLVNLEAMQFGLPIVSSIEGGIPDEVIDQETGFLVETRNAVMLAEKMAILLRDPELRESMGRKGYERFFNHFTLEHFEKNIIRTFQVMLNEEGVQAQKDLHPPGAGHNYEPVPFDK